MTVHRDAAMLHLMLHHDKGGTHLQPWLMSPVYTCFTIGHLTMWLQVWALIFVHKEIYNQAKQQRAATMPQHST